MVIFPEPDIQPKKLCFLDHGNDGFAVVEDRSQSGSAPGTYAGFEAVSEIFKFVIVEHSHDMAMISSKAAKCSELPCGDDCGP